MLEVEGCRFGDERQSTETRQRARLQVTGEGNDGSRAADKLVIAPAGRWTPFSLEWRVMSPCKREGG